MSRSSTLTKADLHQIPGTASAAGNTGPKLAPNCWSEIKSRTPAPPFFFYVYFYEHNFAIPTLFALRTDSAKLIKYKDHDEWTELFDLARDPYEMKNLVHEPAAAPLHSAMDAEWLQQRTR